MKDKFHQHLLELYKDEGVSEQFEDYEYFTDDKDLKYISADGERHRIINLSNDFQLESIGRLNVNNKCLTNGFRMAFKK